MTGSTEHEEEPSLYEIESIIGKRYNHRRIEYLILWRGFPEEEATWESESHLRTFIADMIEEYEDELRAKLQSKQSPNAKLSESRDMNETGGSGSIKMVVKQEDERGQALRRVESKNKGILLPNRTEEVSFGPQIRGVVKNSGSDPQEEEEDNQTLKTADIDKDIDMDGEESSDPTSQAPKEEREDEPEEMNESLAEAVMEMSPYLQHASEPIAPYQTRKTPTPAMKLRESVRNISKRAQKKKKVQEKKKAKKREEKQLEDNKEEESSRSVSVIAEPKEKDNSVVLTPRRRKGRHLRVKTIPNAP